MPYKVVLKLNTVHNALERVQEVCCVFVDVCIIFNRTNKHRLKTYKYLIETWIYETLWHDEEMIIERRLFNLWCIACGIVSFYDSYQFVVLATPHSNFNKSSVLQQTRRSYLHADAVYYLLRVKGLWFAWNNRCSYFIVASQEIERTVAVFAFFLVTFIITLFYYIFSSFYTFFLKFYLFLMTFTYVWRLIFNIFVMNSNNCRYAILFYFIWFFIIYSNSISCRGHSTSFLHILLWFAFVF